MKTYTLNDRLLSTIVAALNQMPAGQVRGILNAIEIDCAAQDKQQAEADAQAQREAIRGELAIEEPAAAPPLTNGQDSVSQRRPQERIS